MINQDMANLTMLIRQLHIKTQYLKKIRQIENELLQNCGYSFKNINEANERFEKNRVDPETAELIIASMGIRRDLANKMKKELRQLLTFHKEQLEASNEK